MPESNYVRLRRMAQQLFLEADANAMAAAWGLEADEKCLYARYFGQLLAIDRRTADISPVEPGGFSSPDWVNETMVLFDVLTRIAPRPVASGRWSSISRLGGVIGAGHDRNLGHQKEAARFAGRCAALERACLRLGGRPAGRADVGCILPVFADFELWVQFWDADEEFPASLRFQFDERALDFMRYETLWYVMAGACERLTFYLDGEARD